MRKGTAALPAEPNPAIQPIDPVSNHFGRIRPACIIAIGNMGPRNKPTKDTATAPPMREGASQTTISSLYNSRNLDYIREKKLTLYRAKCRDRLRGVRRARYLIRVAQGSVWKRGTFLLTQSRRTRPSMRPCGLHYMSLIVSLDEI